MVVSFDVLMQIIYTVTQGNNEKVPSFVMRLEWTLNQIQLQCPRRIMDLEAQQPLKDHLFHGVYKHICDSVLYLYSTLCASYSQVMVATQKAESENEEIWEKVRARAMVTTDSGEETAELEQHITKLMATLIQTRQAAVSQMHQVVPRNWAMDRGTVGQAPQVTQTPTMVRWPWTDDSGL